MEAVYDEFFLQYKFVKREAIIRYMHFDPKLLCGCIKQVLLYGRGSVCK